MNEDQAAAVTGEIQDLVKQTIDDLRTAFGRCILDGHGLSTDPGRQLAALIAAREALSPATVMLDRVCGRESPLSGLIDRVRPNQPEDLEYLRGGLPDGP
jgi:hypothetical protein